MKLKAMFLAIVCATAAMAAHDSGATVLPYKNFDRLVAEAEGIVIGTVRSVRTVPGRDPADLYTYVTIDQLDVISGRIGESTLTLRLKGGFDGRQALHVEGAPEFAAQERVLLFVQGNGRDLVPFVGWGQGVFRLVTEEGGRQTVRDAEGHAVVGLEGGHVMRRAGEALETPLVGAPPLLRQRSSAPRAGGGTADNGSAVTEIGVAAATQPAMDAERFVALVRQRAAGVASRDLRSVQPQDTAAMAPNDSDAAPAHRRAAPNEVARPAGDSVMLPAQRQNAPAGDQR